MRKYFCLGLMVALMLPCMQLQAESYKIKSWEKSSKSVSAEYSADREKYLYQTVDEGQQLRLMPFDSLTLVNTGSSRVYTYVNDSESQRVMKLKDMARRRPLGVLTDLFGKTVQRKKAPVEYKMLGGLSRSELNQYTADTEHLKIYNTISRDVDLWKEGQLKPRTKLELATDTVDGIIRFHITNNSKKSYYVNIVVVDIKSGEMDMVIQFPEHSSSPLLTIEPNTCLLLNEVGYELDEQSEKAFLLVVSTKPYDANYLSALMCSKKIAATADSYCKYIWCEPAVTQ